MASEKTKSIRSSTRSRASQATEPTPQSSSIVNTKIPSDKLHLLRLTCGHKIESNGRPNPRKRWPDPQMCETCKKKIRVVELHYPKIVAVNLTAPNAPKKYLAALKKGKR